MIEATGRVLVSNGDWDLLIPTNGTLLSIQNMTWGGMLGFQEAPFLPIVLGAADDGYAVSSDAAGGQWGIMGVQHFERGLMW